MRRTFPAVIAVTAGLLALSACGDDGGGASAPDVPTEAGTGVVVVDGDRHEGTATCGGEEADVTVEGDDLTFVVTFATLDTDTQISVDTGDGVVEADSDGFTLNQSGPIEALVGELDGAELSDGRSLSAAWACP